MDIERRKLKERVITILYKRKIGMSKNNIKGKLKIDYNIDVSSEVLWSILKKLSDAGHVFYVNTGHKNFYFVPDSIRGNQVRVGEWNAKIQG